ncbi:MAG TPA: filamentous hemagglutinin N-terminal domain-containing protein [Phycisphaerales bacterium]
MSTRRDNSAVRSIAQVAGAACAVRTHEALPHGLKPAALRGDRLAWVSSTLSLLLLLASAQRAHANGPENPNVTHGSASFQNQNGNWVIHTSNKAIINYTRFDVASGQWVRFIQDGSGARVLNRISGSAPTRIDGSIFANGSVYFVNSAGVIFGQNSVINCASFAAAAGQLSDQNFLAGINHFTNLSGAVINHGRIETADGGMAALVGRHVANYGTIVAPQGTVVMAAGSDVYVGEAGGHVFARIQGDGTNAAEGVRNDGVIEARRGTAMLAAGDAYGMAVINTGRLMARNVKIDGGERGEVRVAGTVDASGKDLGETGGRVEITGENIALTGATIDVSGDSGGGTALIGGGREGQGLDHVAKGLYVDQHTTVNADAIRSGDGGEIVLFSRNATRSFGRLQARGGVESGNGGFVETSGGWLALKGTPDTAARALLGIDGTWLIDPLDIEIVAAAPTVDVGGGPIFTPTGGASKLWVEDLKNAFASSSTITIKTVGTVGAGSGNITFNAIFDLPPPASPVLIRTLNVLAAGNIVINQRIVDQNAAAGAGLNLNLAAGGNVNVNAQLLLRQGVLTSSGANFSSNNQIRAAGVNLNHTGAVSVQSIASQFVGGTSSIFVRGSSFDATQSLATGGGNIDIQTTTGSVRFLGAGSSVDAGTGSIVVKAGDRIESNASFNAANVRMDAATQASYTRDIVATNNLELRANVLEFSGPGTINLTAPSMMLRVNDFADAASRIRFLSSINLNGNANVLAGRGEFVVAAGRVINLAPTNKSLLINADTVTIDPAASLISGAGGRLRFQTQTSGRAIALGSSDAGALALSTAELATIGSGWTNIDFLKSGQSGDIRVDSATLLGPSASFLLGSGALRLNDNLTLSGAFTTNGRVLVGAGNIRLTAISTIFGSFVDAGAANANFIVSAGFTDFRAAIGSSSALASLATVGSGEVRLRNLVRTGGANFSGPVYLASDTTFAGGQINFIATLDSFNTGFYNATFLNTSTTFGGTVGGTRALNSLLTTGTAVVNARTFTNGNQTYGGVLVIGGGASSLNAGGAFTALGSTALVRTTRINSASAYFGGTIEATLSGAELTVNAPGDIYFTQAIGAANPLGSLSVIGGGLTHINDVVRVGSGPTNFISFANAVVLDSNVSLIGPNISFLSTLDSGLGGNFGLTATTPSSGLLFAQNVGGTRALSFINTVGNGRTVAQGNISTLGNQDYSAFEVSGLAGNRALSSLAGNITFNDAVGATNNTVGLEIDAAGLTTFNSTVGSGLAGTGALAELLRSGGGATILRGDTTTVGQQSFDGDVRFAKLGLQTINAGGPITITGKSELETNVDMIVGAADLRGAVDSIGGPRALHVTSAGLIDFGSTIGATGPLASLLVDGGGQTRVTTLVDAATATFNNAVNLTGNTVFQGGPITFNSTLDSLTANAFGAEFKGNAGLGTLDFTQNVGQSRALAFLISRIDTTVRANVSTANQQQFDRNLAILGPSTFNAGGLFSVGGNTRITRRTDINANGVTFTGLVDSGAALPPADRGELFITSPGAITFVQAIGSADALRTLDVAGGGLTTINATIDADNADFRNAAELGSSVTLRNGTYTFHQTLDSALAGPFALNTLGVGTLSFLNTVGGTRELLSLDALNAAQTVLAANVTTRDFARFAATRVDADSLITSTNAGAIDFGVVTSGGVPRDLATNTSGITSFNGDVGTAGARLASLRTLGSGDAVLRGNTFTTGTQSFAANAIFDSGANQTIDAGGPLFVGGTSTLRNDLLVLSNGATFTGAVDGDAGPARSLTVTSASPILFGAAIGQTNALQSILVNGGGATTLNTLVRTTAGGNADFQNAVLLGSDLNLTGGTFRFGQTLDSGVGGPFALASTGSNSIEFVGNVGIGSLLRSIDTALAADTRLHADLAARDAIRLSTLRLLDAANKNIASATSTIDFLGAVAADAGAGLNVAAPGTVTFASTVGSGIPALGSLGFLNRTGGGLTVLNGNTDTVGLQGFDGDLDVNGPLTLNAGGAFGVLGATRLFGNTVINSNGYLFNGSVDSAGGSRSLTLNNTGSGEFKSGAGFGSALSALTINGVGTSTFAGNIRIVPGGSMIVNQSAFIAGPSDFRAGTITFNGTLDAAPAAAISALVLVADAANFNFNAGGVNALTSLDASGVTLSRVAGDVTTTGSQRFAGLLLTGAAGSRVFNGSSLAYVGAIDAANNTIGMIANGPGGVGFASNIGLGGVGGTNLAQLLVSGPATLAGNVRTVGGTSFGNALTTIGARTIDAAGLFVGGQTVLGGNFTVNTANAQFNGSVDSAAPGLASMLVNATNTAVFGNGIGQNAALSTFRSNASATVLRGSGLRTLASGQSWFAGELRIDSLGGTSTINTGTIFIARDVFTDAAAASAANLSLLANAPSTIEGSAIRIGGSIGQSSVAPSGTQRFNNLTLGGAIGTPNIATILLSRGFDAQGRLIAASVNAGDQFSIVANNIAMAPGQKLTAIGSLGLFGASSITLGDVATLGNLSVNSPVIRITSRGAANLFNNTGGIEGDIGTDIVAGGTISFSSTPTLLPGAGSFSYSAGGGPDPLLASFSYRQLPSAINLATFRDQRVGSPLGPSFLLFLDLASRGPTSTSVAETKTVQPPRLGEVARVRQSVVVDPADQELLRQLGLTVRGATNEEIVASFAGYSYYVNVPQKLRPSVENREYVVTADRLWMQAVVELSKVYNATMKRSVVKDGAGTEQLRDGELRQIFEESWDRYIASSNARSEAEELQGFTEHLVSSPAEVATRQELANIGLVLAKLDDLGLTKLEAGIPRDRLLQRVRPAALTTADMTAIIRTVTASGVKPNVAPDATPDATPSRPTTLPPTQPAVAETATKVLEVSKR